MGFSERKHRAALEAPACAIHKIFVGQPADIGWLAGASADLAGSLVVEPSEAAGDSIPEESRQALRVLVNGVRVALIAVEDALSVV